MNNNLEELITALYDMIQDAKSVPLSSDKCIIERDKALDMLDDLSAQLPAELKQARTIVASREELVSQARREAENIIRNAHAEAEKLIEHETIYQQTLAKCQEMAKANMDECAERIRQTEAQMEQIKAASFGYVDNSLRYIQYNYASNIGVADIARYVGISRSQLYRAFLQDFGVSPHAYLQTYRINEACSLLRDPAYSVAEVAGSVGFNDPLYFSRVFKSIKGVTPSDYQKKRSK